MVRTLDSFGFSKRNVVVAASQMKCGWDEEANIANAEKLVRMVCAALPCVPELLCMSVRGTPIVPISMFYFNLDCPGLLSGIHGLLFCLGRSQRREHYFDSRAVL